MISGAGLTIDGLASGLDTQKVIDQLMAIERRPLTQLASQKSALETLQGVWKDVNSRLLSLQTKAEALKDAQAFNSMKAVSSDTTVVTAAASNSALAGTYQITISQLAQAQVDISDAFASTTTALNVSGTLTINGVGISIAGTDTLGTIKDKINATTSTSKVSAAIVQTSPGSYQLVLTGTQTGTANTISAPTGLSFTTKQAAQQAKLTVNGVDITSNTNTVSDVVPGTTLSLVKTGTAAVTIGRDIDGIVKTIKDFVDQFNSLSSFIADKQSWDAEKKIAGPLLGDPTASGIISSLRADLADPVYGLGAGAPSTLAEIGIATGKYGTSDYGKLVLDETRLRNMLQSNPDGVIALFTGDNGMAARIANYAKGYTDPISGILSRKDKDISSQIKDMADRIQTMNDRLDAQEERYKAQFAALETALGKLKNQQTWLTQQLAQLGGQ